MNALSVISTFNQNNCTQAVIGGPVFGLACDQNTLNDTLAGAGQVFYNKSIITNTSGVGRSGVQSNARNDVGLGLGGFYWAQGFNTSIQDFSTASHVGDQIWLNRAIYVEGGVSEVNDEGIDYDKMIGENASATPTLLWQQAEQGRRLLHSQAVDSAGLDAPDSLPLDVL